MIYFDTSYLFRLYFDEPGAEAVRNLLDTGKTPACSIHGQTELIAAVHRNYRERALPQTKFRAILKQIQLDSQAGHLLWLPLQQRTIDLTFSAYSKAPARFFLRAADALHLASARENGFKIIYSNDKRLLESAPLFDLKGKNIIEPP